LEVKINDSSNLYLKNLALKKIIFIFALQKWSNIATKFAVRNKKVL